MSDLCEGAKDMLDSHPDYDASMLRFNDMDSDYLYSIYDICSGTYCTPFVLESDNSALRSFSDYCLIPDTTLSKHPEDFELYCLGSYNKKTGIIKSEFKPRLLAKAVTFVYSAKLKSNKSSVGSAENPQEDGIALAEQVTNSNRSENDFYSHIETQDAGGDIDE